MTYLTETRHAGRGSFGNMFIINQGVPNQPKVFGGVLRYEFSYIKVRRALTNLESICLQQNTISLVFLVFNNKRLLEYH